MKFNMCFNLYYLIPGFPLVTRFLLYLRFPYDMTEYLTEVEKDRESHRSYILALAGFSFSGLLAIAVLDTALQQNFKLSVYYLFISFLCYLFTLNMQSYKARRWHDQMATAFMDAASLSLIMSVLSILYSQNTNKFFKIILSIIALLFWGIDHFIRIRIQWKYLKIKGGKSKNE